MVAQEDKMTKIATVLLMGATYIAFSWALINYNKHLMSPGVFPYSGGLGLLHTGASSILALVLYLVKPSMFTYISEAPSRAIDASLIFKAVLPISLCFAAQIVLSNHAYLFADVAFLQMLKESNVVAVYLFSVLFAIEVFKWQNARILACVVIATWMTIKGELHFTLAALLLQGTSFIGESLKITLQGYLLSSEGSRKMDSYSYLLIVMPACFGLFGAFLLFCAYALPPGQNVVPTPSMQDWKNNAHLLLGNACVAVGLNVSGTLFVKATSAVSYVLTGILKDVLIVVTGILFMGHECSILQGVGFFLQVATILTWSLMKTFPKEFEDGIFLGLHLVMVGSKADSVTGAPSTYGATKASV